MNRNKPAKNSETGLDSRSRKIGRKKRPADAAYLDRAAAYYSQRYSSSVANFKVVLRRKVRKRGLKEGVTPAEAESWIDDLAAKYIRLGALDDAGYARARVRYLRNSGKSAAFIRSALRSKGVDPIDITAAIETHSHQEDGDPEIMAAAKLARRRRIGPYRRDPSDDDPVLRKRELSVFARAGFSYAVALKVLNYSLDEAEKQQH